MATAGKLSGLDAFHSEAVRDDARVASFPNSAASAPRSAGNRSSWTGWRVWLAGVAAIAAVAVAAYEYRLHATLRRVPTGALTIETVPSGMEIFVANRTIGRSPVTVSLPAGSYQIQLGAGAGARTVTVPVAGGAAVIQHYEMAPASSAPLAVGTVRVETEPAKLQVQLDETEEGTSPVTIPNVTPGVHKITVRAEHGAVKRAVRVTAGETTSVIVASVSPATSEVTAGWLSIASAVPLQIRSGGRLVGTSDVDKVMLPSGDYTVELVNEQLGFRTQRRVKVLSGKTAQTSIDVPNGVLSVNALPWADVFIDGRRMGQTPLGNLSVPIGRHDVVFRHPDLGERSEAVTVTLLQPARLGVDLRKK